jgi:uncharacterized membrane protein
MLRPRYSQSELFKKALKLTGGKGVAKRVVPISAKKTGFDTNESMYADILAQLGGAYSDKLDAEATKRDRDAADEMLEDYLKPQPAWKVEDDGSTPKTLRDAGFNVSMSDALGDQSLEGDEPADQNWMTADESKQFYNDEADRQQKDFDTRYLSGIDALKGSYATPGRQSMIDKLTGNTPADTVGPMTRSMKLALMRDSAGKRESDEARLLAEQDARVKYTRGIEGEARKANRVIDAASVLNQQKVDAAKIAAANQRKIKLDEREIQIGDEQTKIELRAYYRAKEDHDKAYLDMGLPPPAFRPFRPSSSLPNNATRATLPVETDSSTDADQIGGSGQSPAEVGVPKGINPPSNPIQLSKGFKKVNEEFAKVYNEWTTKGGKSDFEKQSEQLESALNALRNPKKNTSGNILGVPMTWWPDSVRAQFNPGSVDVWEKVAEVSQRNLRAVLGGQFAMKEGDRLISRAYNPDLDESLNASRVSRLLKSMRKAAQAKESAISHFTKTGTLAGWEGTLPSLGSIERDARLSATDIENEDDNIGAYEFAIENPDDPRAALILQKLEADGALKELEGIYAKGKGK